METARQRLKLLTAAGLLAVTILSLHARTTPAVPPDGYLSAVPDTIRDTVAAGTPYIAALPEGPDQKIQYDLIRGPALSWLVDRSIFWNTRPDDAGRHEILIRAADETQTDTLVLSLTVTP